LSTLNLFKQATVPQHLSESPSYYSFGNRRVNIIHTKLRNQCSSLKQDLFRVNLVESSECSCVNPCENAPLYDIM